MTYGMSQGTYLFVEKKKNSDSSEYLINNEPYSDIDEDTSPDVHTGMRYVIYHFSYHMSYTILHLISHMSYPVQMKDELQMTCAMNLI